MQRMADNGDETRAATASYIREHTDPGDTILVLGMGAEQYFLTGRRAASRYFYPAPFYTEGYCTPRIVRQFSADLKKNRPRLIIDKVPGCPPDIEPGLPPIPMTWTVWKTIPEMDAVLQRLSRQYQYMATIGPDQWRVYRRK